MLKLIDLIKLAGVELQSFKIHCATSGGIRNPLEEFYAGKFKEWQEQQNKENFKCQHVLALIDLENDRNQWLFAGAFKILDVKPGKWKKKTCFQYTTRELTGLNHLTGRAIIRFDKTFRASYLLGANFGNQLEVAAIRDERMTIGDFPGFNDVRISYTMLKTLINESNPSWHAALSSVAGIYLITDTKTGKLYVGSAYGDHGIWQRWSAYAKTGHGGNKELRKLLKAEGKEYVRHFQFSLLEFCGKDSSENVVLNRENHWKEVLKSREFGLNEN